MTQPTNPRSRVVALLVIQLVLVLSVAGKYLYERMTRPRVWVRTVQVDPDQPLRGRYLALQLSVNACSLPHDDAHSRPGYRIYNGGYDPGQWTWNVSLAAADGHLVPHLEEHPSSSRNIESLTLPKNMPCDHTRVEQFEEYFIPDRAKPPFPLKAGQELWVEVTVPPAGPPRPIQLALSTPTSFHPLHFN